MKHHYLLLAGIAALAMGASAALTGCDGVPIPSGSVSREIDSDGGVITLKDDRGFEVTLDIHEDALTEPTTITITPLLFPPRDPVANNIVPGVIIEPEGLQLNEPAQLKIALTKGAIGSDPACIYRVEQSDLVIPIGNQQVDTENNYIEGEIYHFSTYSAGKPTEQEIIDQVHRAREEIGITADSCGMHAYNGTSGYQGWQSTYTNLSGFLEWAQMLQAFGNDAAAEKAVDGAKSVLSQGIEDFLKLPVPDEPCGWYFYELMKYLKQSMTLLDTGSQAYQDIYNRGEEILNKCSYRFSLEIELIDTIDTAVNKMEDKGGGNVNFYLPFYGVDKGFGSIEGEGNLDYTHHDEWLWDKNKNTWKTEDGTKTCKVTCGGYMDVSEEQKLMLHLTLHEDCHYSGTTCIPEPDVGCQPVDGSNIENESFDLPVKDGYQILSEKNDPENGKYVKYSVILHVIHALKDSSP
jgi:hypothetical protein